MQTFTVDQIKNYLLSQDSMGDILYNLSEENIKKANKTIVFTLSEILQSCNDWQAFCDICGYSEWVLNEGGGDQEVEMLIYHAKKFGLV